MDKEIKNMLTTGVGGAIGLEVVDDVMYLGNRGVTGGVQGGGFLGAFDPQPFQGAPAYSQNIFLNSYLKIQFMGGSSS